jgi:hypothetical protein
MHQYPADDQQAFKRAQARMYNSAPRLAHTTPGHILLPLGIQSLLAVGLISADVSSA